MTEHNSIKDNSPLKKNEEEKQNNEPNLTQVVPFSDSQTKILQSKEIGLSNIDYQKEIEEKESDQSSLKNSNNNNENDQMILNIDQKGHQKSSNYIKKDWLDKLLIIQKFLSMIFPALLGLFDFIMDILYVFVYPEFKNQDLKYAAWFCFFLAPFICLIAWLLLFSYEKRSQKCKSFLKYQKIYNEEKISTNPAFFHQKYIIWALLCQQCYSISQMLRYFFRGLYFTIFQQIKFLVVYVQFFSGYEPTYLITENVLREFESNQKILKQNYQIHHKNQKIDTENQKKSQHNKEEENKFNLAQNKIKEISKEFCKDEEKQTRIQDSIYLPSYKKFQKLDKKIEIYPPLKDVTLDSGISHNSDSRFTFEYMENVSQDAVLQSFLLIGDLIESAFEALPMLVLQYVNNSFSGWNTLSTISFISSTIMVIYSSIKIVSMLFEFKLTSAIGIFSLLTQKTKENNNNNDTNDTDISFKKWIEEEESNNEQKEQNVLSEDPFWFQNNNEIKEIRIINIDELQVLSKWRKKQFSRYEKITFNFAHQSEPILVFTIQKLKELFQEISQYTTTKNMISFDFYETPLTNQDKLEIYGYYKHSEVSGFIFEEQLDNEEMEISLIEQILSQFGKGTLKLKNIKIIFNQRNTIKYSGYGAENIQLQEAKEQFNEFLAQNISNIDKIFEIHNHKFESSKYDWMKEFNKIYKSLTHFRYECQEIHQQDIQDIHNLPKLQSFHLLADKGQVENIDSLLQNCPNLKEIILHLPSNKIKNLGIFHSEMIQLEKFEINMECNRLNSLENINEFLSLNENLKQFSLNLNRNQIQNIDELGKGIANTKNLEQFTLIFNGNEIENTEQLGKAIATNKNLQQFTINLEQNQIQNVDELGKAIRNCLKLQQFTLNLNSNKIQNIDELGNGIGNSQNLQHFTLNLNSNQFKNIDQLGKGIGTTDNLFSFKLDLNGNGLQNINELGKGIANCTKLEQFAINLNGNQIQNIGEFDINSKQLRQFTLNMNGNRIEQIDELGKSIQNCSNLEQFILNFNSNQIKNIDELAKGIEKSNKLEQFTMNLKVNNIQNIDELGKAIENNNNLQQFTMDFVGNEIKIIDELGKGIEKNNNLRQFTLNLNRNSIENIEELANAIENSTNLEQFQIHLNNTSITNLQALRNLDLKSDEKADPFGFGFGIKLGGI